MYDRRWPGESCWWVAGSLGDDACVESFLRYIFFAWVLGGFAREEQEIEDKGLMDEKDMEAKIQ